jgi:restriction endonuclease S subunit
MKKGWQTKKVREIARHSLGKMLDKAKNKGEPQPYLRNLNVRWFDFDLSDVLEMPFLPTEVEKYTAVKGDVLICEGGYPGRAAIWEKDEPIYFQKALHRVRFHEPERNRWFLYYLLSKDLDGTLKNHFNGAGIQHFTGEALAQFEVPLPPLAEQQRIVGLLDEAFECLATAKANAEKNLQNARALFESHLQSVFTQRGPGWVEKSLGETCEMYQPKTIGTKDLVPDGPYPVFGANGVIGRYDKFNHEEPQLLVTCRGATCGSVNISEPKSWITGNAMVVRPKDHALDLHFLEFVFRGGIDISAAITGAAQPQITRTNLSPLLIRFPKSVTEQTRLAEKFEALTEETQRLARLYERKHAALEALKKSLLHQAFAGEL